MVRIGEYLEVPESEFEFATSRSSGPGGQNVNKVNTRVTLLWDLASSPSLTDSQKELVRSRLGGRINAAGVMRVTSQRHRTQLANREAAVDRFSELLAEALTVTPERAPVRVSASSERKRLQNKRRRGRLKRERAGDFDLDD